MTTEQTNAFVEVLEARADPHGMSGIEMLEFFLEHARHLPPQFCPKCAEVRNPACRLCGGAGEFSRIRVPLTFPQTGWRHMVEGLRGALDAVTEEVAG